MVANEKITVWFDIDNTLYPRSAQIAELMKQVRANGPCATHRTNTNGFQRIHGGEIMFYFPRVQYLR